MIRRVARIVITCFTLISASSLLTAQQPIKKYSGAPIDLDLQGADLRTVLRSFAETNGLNIVIDPAVRGTVDIKLTAVPWDQALDIILKGQKLGYVLEGTVVRVAPLAALAEEEGERRKLTDAQALSGNLEVRTYSLSYAQAGKLEPLVKYAALSLRGEIRVDDRTNTLIIRDLPDRLTAAEALIATLDRAEPQVEIEARIVQTSRDAARELGVQWGVNGRVAPELGNTTNLAFPNRGTLSGRVGNQAPNDPRATPVETSGTAINLPVSAPTSALGLSLGAINGAFGLDVALSALERNGKGTILARPRVTTQNNHEAQMTQGIQIPIQTVANNTVTVQFKDAALRLVVTPQITAANTVIMQIELENATADFARQVNGIPPIDTQRAVTRVQVSDGATTVIGGIVVSREQSSQAKTPGLGSIPLLGWLFRHEANQNESRELLIFISPRIIRSHP
jgi:type IV pilus assembly protein PilQ